MEFEGYKHGLPIQIRFGDIDRLNHVNNACYLSYFEAGRVNYFQQIFQGHDWTKTGFVVARSEINHLKPIHLEDQIHCFTRVTRLGNKSMRVENSLVKVEQGRCIVCADGVGILVAMDYSTRLSMPLPDFWRKAIKDFEGKVF